MFLLQHNAVFFQFRSSTFKKTKWRGTLNEINNFLSDSVFLCVDFFEYCDYDKVDTLIRMMMSKNP